ncbi:MAG TPA: hypothetical protein VFN65_13835 [Solirubrobacteraceae bacterium]|nr:hypothetical protein [Solirubrobacteraceae bacterium]
MQAIVRWQRIALTCGGILGALTLTGAELGGGASLLVLPCSAGLMSALIGGLLWIWATMIRFDRPGDDGQSSGGNGGPKVPEGPSSPPRADWDGFDAARRDWARDREPTPV